MILETRLKNLEAGHTEILDQPLLTIQSAYTNFQADRCSQNQVRKTNSQLISDWWTK